ncbi:SDR family oxidoreductase [Castellaniella sp. GW247-6E4]|uniref:SDR family NAD(P)-dependent oxidoreductase n=1 Tax=Castellaniella sp. GW247-6E4 TaxID=3140380 RepID=UPI003314C7C3
MIPQTPSFRLDGRRALVTGAGRGIGLACAAALAQAGAEVVMVARSRDDIEHQASLIRAAGLAARAMVLDVTDADGVDAFFAANEPFHVLVNNAGTNRPKPIIDTPDVDFDAVVDLNLRAAWRIAREWCRVLLRTRTEGSLINISSQMGLVGSPGRTVYCATKHAIEGLTKALAWEMGAHGIRVNTVCPTFVETEMTRPMFEDSAFRDMVMSMIALGRLARVEDLMGPVVFLASDASAMVTGSALVVDGGWTAR